MRINTNLTALNTFNSYTSANNKIADSVAKLSSGYAINSAADNAAGLAISEKMRAQIRGLDTAASNSQDAISLVQTAQGALESAGEILQRMREISVQSSSDTNVDAIDREALQSEFEQLQAELDEIAQDSTFNNQNLLDGSLSTTQLSVGSGTSLSGSGMNVSVGNANAGTYGFGVSVVTTQAAVAAAAPTTADSSFSMSSLSGEFSSAEVTIGTNAESSSLLNGNYELSATYDSTGESITVTATGDNGQTFSCDLTDADFAAVTSGTDITLDFGTTAGAGDTFSVTMTAGETLIANADATTSELSAMAGSIGGTFTVSGGSDSLAEETAIMASLTGATSVEMKAGMDSVTFDNGITVSFEALTAADLDTTATGGMAVETGDASISAVEVSNLDINGGAVADLTTLNGDYAMTVTAGPDLSFTNSIETYTATVVAPTGGVTGDNVTITFTGTSTTTFDMTVTLGADCANADAIATAVAAAVTGTMSEIFDANTANAADDGFAGVAYNFESVFGDTANNAALTADTGVSTSTIEVISKANDGLTIQVGANSGDELSINIDSASAEHLGIKGLDVTNQESAAAAIDVVNSAINQISSQRAYLGAIENRLDYKIDNLETSSQNLTSAESSIRDVDMAAEMTAFTNANILSQAATAMLAQANSLPQNVLSLLG